MECLRCNTELKFLKEYRFDSQDNNRGILKSLFDVEEHLILKYMYVQSVNIVSLYIMEVILGLIVKIIYILFVIKL